MDFLLTTKPRRDETVVNINMDVYLWSSAMPRNVKNMLDRFLSSWRRELLGTWTRDNLDLDPMDYLGNPKTWKDLMKLLDHLKERRQPSFTDRRLPRGTVFTLDNVALIEDSFSKARLQPLNHLPITEFTIADYENTMRTLRRVRLMPKNDGDIEDGTDEDYDSATDFDGPSKSTGFYIKYLSGSKSYRARGDVGLKMDAMLLAVIGIISELQDVDSIPVWMASGGLMPPVDHTFTGMIASRGWAYVVQIDNGSKTIPIPKLNIKDHVVPATLPYHEEHPKWYDSPIHVLYWLRRGFLALDARGIDVEHGMR
ncbi:hypothetical protein NCC49_000598 [Naganishia albida]|nr:hypothetical protein NCC49_000598 [Naganishia albida]